MCVLALYKKPLHYFVIRKRILCIYVCTYLHSSNQWLLYTVLKTIFKLDKRRLQAGLHQFLKIDPVWIVSMHVRLCVCVCVSTPEGINN